MMMMATTQTHLAAGRITLAHIALCVDAHFPDDFLDITARSFVLLGRREIHHSLVNPALQRHLGR